MINPTAARVVERLDYLKPTDRRLRRLAEEEWEATVSAIEDRLRPDQPAQPDQRHAHHVNQIVDRAYDLLALRGPLPRPPPRDLRSLVALRLPSLTTTTTLTTRLLPRLGAAASIHVRQGHVERFAFVTMRTVAARDAALPLVRSALRALAPKSVVRRARTPEEQRQQSHWARRQRHHQNEATRTKATDGAANRNRFAALSADDDDPPPSTPTSSPPTPSPPATPSPSPTPPPPPPKRRPRFEHNGQYEHLLVGTWNARGLRSPIKAGLLYAQLLSTSCLDVLAVQETWMPERGATTPVVPGYTWHGRPRPDQPSARPAGGVGILVADRLAHRLKVLSGTTETDADEPYRAEHLWARLDLPGAASPVILCCAYWPPTAGDRTVATQAYATQLKADLTIYQPLGNVIVLGDLNSHLGAGANDMDVIGQHHLPETNESGRALRPLLKPLGLVALNGRNPHDHVAERTCTACSTYYSAGNRGFATDYILVERHVQLNLCHCGVETAAEIGNSDHRPVLAHVPIPQRNINRGPPPPPGAAPAPPRYSIRRMHPTRADAADVRAAYGLAIADGVADLNHDPDADANTRWAALLNAVRRAADITIGRRNPQAPRPRARVPWWDEELRRAAQERHRLHVAHTTTDTVADLTCLTAARKVGKDLAETKRKAWEGRRDQDIRDTLDAEGLSKSLWRAIDDLVPSPSQRIPGVRAADGTIYDDDPTINMAFRAHFAVLDAGADANALFDNDNKVDTTTKLNRKIADEAARATMEADTNPISLDEVKMALKMLSSGTAPGPDGLDPVLLKAGGDALVAALHDLLQHSWTSERVPTDWQLGEIVPLHKSGDRAEPTNYRGITLQPAALKVLCQILLTRLQAILDPADPTKPGCSPLADEQAGFRHDRGCIDHAYIVKAAIDDARHRETPLLIAFLDVQKAYDSVWRDGLWWKLHEHGVRGKLWRMLRALYSSVEARVRTNNMVSPPITLHTGLRQGCVLSPILFDVYIDDLIKDLHKLDVVFKLGDHPLPGLLFADDVALIARSPTSMAAALACTSAWCRKWRMQINHAKCKAMLVNPPPGPQTFPRLNGKPIDIVASFRYLGVELSSNGGWTSAIEHRITSTGRATSRLIPLLCNKKLPVAVRLIVWNALVRAKLDYGAELIEPSTSDETRLSRCVWRAGKLAIGVNGACLTRAIEADLGLLSYADRSNHLALRWRIRVASRAPTDLTRRVWNLSVNGRISSSTATRIEALVGVHGLRARITELEAGNRTRIGEAKEKARGAVLAHRTARLLEPPTDATRTKDRFYLQLIDPTSPGKCLGWLRGTGPQPRLRFTLRAGVAPLIIELGRFRQVPQEQRYCRFCDTRTAVEDAEHFIMNCPCWADERMALNDAIDDALSGLTYRPQAHALARPATAWFRALGPAHQVRLLLGAPVPNYDDDINDNDTGPPAAVAAMPSPWTAKKAATIMKGLHTAFVQGIWPMWCARQVRVEAFGPKGIPIKYYKGGRWKDRGTGPESESDDDDTDDSDDSDDDDGPVVSGSAGGYVRRGSGRVVVRGAGRGRIPDRSRGRGRGQRGVVGKAGGVNGVSVPSSAGRASGTNLNPPDVGASSGASALGPLTGC